jgi:hypothetical protein
MKIKESFKEYKHKYIGIIIFFIYLNINLIIFYGILMNIFNLDFSITNIFCNQNNQIKIRKYIELLFVSHLFSFINTIYQSLSNKELSNVHDFYSMITITVTFTIQYISKDSIPFFWFVFYLIKDFYFISNFD